MMNDDAHDTPRHLPRKPRACHQNTTVVDLTAHEMPEVVADALMTPDPSEWAQRIRSSLAKSVEAIVETGRLFIQARATLSHGSFEAMIRDELGMSPRTVQQYMQIARHPALANPQHAALLPAKWSALAELSRVKPELLTKAITQGAVGPTMTRRDVALLESGDAEKGVSSAANLTDSQAEQPAPEKKKAKRTRPRSRAERWADAVAEANVAREKVEEAWVVFADAIEMLKEMQEEYVEWRDNQPENLQGSASATSEKLDAVADLDLDFEEPDFGPLDEAEGLDLPMGFGRD